MINTQWFGSRTEGRAEIVLLHEGLGSISAWGDFPSLLSASTQRAVLAFDRLGYGRSNPNPPPWPADFMHHEARALAELLALHDIDRPILVGHSDGATIALLYPSECPSGPPALAIVSLAAHVSVEEKCLIGIEAVKKGYASSLAPVLARHHDDADAVFEGWSEIWTSDRFRQWTIDGALGRVTCPVLAFQGTADTYATRRQLERIGAAVNGPVELIDVAGADHWPHREAPEVVLGRVQSFLTLLDLDT